MADVPLMPESVILNRRREIPPKYARKPRNPLGIHGILLMGHGARTRLPLGEAFLHLADFGLLKVPDLNGNLLHRRRENRQGRHHLGVPVPLQHLS